jgi:manganese/zinc/iron transport system permease protein
MLIVPAATAQLLTRRLLPMLLVSAGLASAAAVLGHAGAVWLPSLAGFPPTSTAGTMAFVSGLLFLVAMITNGIRPSKISSPSACEIRLGTPAGSRAERGL